MVLFINKVFTGFIKENIKVGITEFDILTDTYRDKKWKVQLKFQINYELSDFYFICLKPFLSWHIFIHINNLKMTSFFPINTLISSADISLDFA